MAAVTDFPTMSTKPPPSPPTSRHPPLRRVLQPHPPLAVIRFVGIAQDKFLIHRWIGMAPGGINLEDSLWMECHGCCSSPKARLYSATTTASETRVYTRVDSGEACPKRFCRESSRIP